MHHLLNVPERWHLWTCQVLASRQLGLTPRQLGINAHSLGTDTGATGEHQREQGMNPRRLPCRRKPARAECCSERKHIDGAHIIEQQPAGNITLTRWGMKASYISRDA
jgi:hypothetical protein